MKCPRCQGLVIRDQIFDPDGPFLHIAILRCLNCGGTSYLNKSLNENNEEPEGSKSAKRVGVKAA